MALVATHAAVRGPHDPLLLPTSLRAERGEVTLVVADPGPASTTLALALGGRIALDEGDVRLDGDPDPVARRRAVALVDVPGVTEPDGGLPVRVVVGEELALAGLPSRRRDIAAYLADAPEPHVGTERWESLPPITQTSWQAALAAQRPGVEALVLAGPDRRGGSPDEWYATAAALAARGLVVVVLATHAAVALLGLSHDPRTFEAGVA